MQPLHSETVMRHQNTHLFSFSQNGESIATSIIRWWVQELCGWGQHGVTSSCSSKIQGHIFFSTQLCNPCIVRLWWGIKKHPFSSSQYGESIATSIIRWGVQELCGWGQQGVTTSCSSKILGCIFFSTQLCNPCIVRLWWGIKKHTYSLSLNMENPLQHQSLDEGSKNFVAGVSKEWLVVAVAKLRVTYFSPCNYATLA